MAADLPCRQDPGPIRILRPEEMDAYLDLRQRVAIEEGWTTQDDNRDAFDDIAVPFGYFIGDSLVGGIRLIPAEGVEALPCGPYVAEPRRYAGPVAELSRAAVDHAHRGNGYFTALIAHAIRHAQHKQVQHLVLSAYARKRGFYAKLDFVPIRESIEYNDSHVSVRESASVYWRALDRPPG